MAEVPLKWKSRIVTHTSFNEALATIKKPDTKVMYGLDEARMLLMNEAEISDESKTHFYIVGDAIHATTTRNLHRYLAEELEASVETLAGCPIMVDHGKGSLDNAGKVLVTSWENRGGLDSAITYVARVRKSHPVAEAVALGDIDTVSVGATARLVECSICGNDMLGKDCSHRIGNTYEVDDVPVLATAIGRGLKFRELSITPFPADEQASANITTNSILSAMEIWVESSEIKPKLSGEETKMSEDQKEDLGQAEELLREKKELESQVANFQKEQEKFSKTIEELKTNEVNGLVDQVIETGIAANLYESDDIEKHKKDLRTLGAETLREKLSDYKMMVTKIIDKPVDVKSTAMVGDEKVIEQTPERKSLTYTKDEVKSGLREAMGGLRTSEYAKRTMRKIAFDPYNPNREENLKIFAENTQNTRRLE